MSELSMPLHRGAVMTGADLARTLADPKMRAKAARPKKGEENLAIQGLKYGDCRAPARPPSPRSPGPGCARPAANQRQPARTAAEPVWNFSLGKKS